MAGAIGRGCDLLISFNGGSSYSSLGSILDIGGPQQKTSDKDVSYMQQPDNWKRFISGLIDAGEGKVKLLWSGANFATLQAKIGVFTTSGASTYWKIVWNDLISSANSTLVCQGYIKDVSDTIPLDDVMTFEVTLKASGPPTFAQAT